MSDALPVTQSYDTQFQYGDQSTADTSSLWTKLANVVDIKPPKVEAADIDTTPIDQPDQAKTFVAGWATAGEATIKINAERSQMTTIWGLFRVNKGFRIMFNDGSNEAADGSILKWDGYIKSIENEVVSEKLVTADIVVKVSGLPEFVEGN